MRCIALVVALLLAACGAPPPPHAPDEVSRLATAIRALGPEVDPEEAARAARVTYTHTAVLARQYQITDSPIVHNTKVNMGLKPRGLCWHWAHDIEKRLKAEDFETLQTHRAIAEPNSALTLEHSTAIISARGDSFDAGLVLDPWRAGGRLTWMPVAQDDRYDWEARSTVMARKLERAHGQSVTVIDDERLLVAGREYVPQ